MAFKKASRAPAKKKAPVKPPARTPRPSRTSEKKLGPVAQHLKDLEDAAAATRRKKR